MEAYEDNLEKMSEHKKTVRDSTKATRDVYKNTDAKIRDYERESRRNYEDDAPVIRRHVTTEASSKPAASVTSTASRPISNYSSVAQEEVTPSIASTLPPMEALEQATMGWRGEEVPTGGVQGEQ